MSVILQGLKTDVNKARNLTYMGKYQVAIQQFNRIISKIQQIIFTITDKILLNEWNKLFQEIKHERDYVIETRDMLAGNFQTSKGKREERSSNRDIRDKEIKDNRQRERERDRDLPRDLPVPRDRDIPTEKERGNESRAFENRAETRGEQRQQPEHKHYPFGKEPFKKHVIHEDDQLYNRKERQQRERQAEQQRLFEERQAEIWPKKKPAMKKNTSTKPTTNNNNNTNNTNSNQSGLNAGRGYNKPWLSNAAIVKPGGKDQEKKSFLKARYPDGNGPDTNLIEMLEKEVIDFNPNITFEDIAELQKAKDVLEEAVLLPLAMPQLFTGIRKAWKGVLLFGPPGTGKTLLAKAIASSGKTTFFNVTASSLASKWKGQSQKLVRILFEMAQFYAPATIFIDQIDALASKRGERQDQSSRKVKTELMTCIDGASGEEMKQMVVIGATNRPWDLDEAIRRRLQKRIYIPLPTQIGRRELLRINLKNVSTEQLDMDDIVNKTDGMSGADITNLCKEAAYMPMRRKLRKEGGLGKKLGDAKWMSDFQKEVTVPLTMEDFAEALKNVKPSVGKGDLLNYDEWMKEYGEQGTN